MASDQLSSMTSIPEPIHVSVSVAAGRRILIAVSGELDIVGAPAFAAACADLNVEAADHVVLDLGQLDFIDAAGLHAVLALHETCIETSATLTIMPGPIHVRRVFERTGTDRQLPIRGR
jgi:anti-sigma B factor antagonist